MSEFQKWRDYLRGFAGDRDWEQFHNPKNLSMALSVEAGELVELFQWLSLEQAANPNEELKVRAGEEISDVILYSIRMADKLGIDLYSNNLTLEYFKELIYKKKKVILCRFLFDQGNIAGIGNYIINEVLYLSKLIPEMKVSELTNNDIKKLYNNILFVGYSNLLSHLKGDNIKIDKKDYERMPLKKNLEVPYKMKIYGRKETDKGVKVKTKKICSRKMYYE